MDARAESEPAVVPEGAKQAGEVEARRERWAWAEPSVWTDSMLAALENGVKGGKWFSLIDKVYADGTLELAWAKVRSNAGGSGVDHITVARFAKDCPRGLLDLKEQLRMASYQPLPVKRVWKNNQSTTTAEIGQTSSKSVETRAGTRESPR